jgi:hypothetical protein
VYLEVEAQVDQKVELLVDQVQVVQWVQWVDLEVVLMEESQLAAQLDHQSEPLLELQQVYLAQVDQKVFVQRVDLEVDLKEE